MKRGLTILTAICILASAVELSAQEYTQTPVTVSKEKIRDSDGKVYLSHIVMEKQTLFSIAKAYGVTIDQIYEANAELDLKNQGVKKGSVLKIPIVSAVEEVVKEVESSKETKETKKGKAAQIKEQISDEAKEIKDNVTTHIVKWYEDIEDIAEKYGVKVEEIMEANKLKNKKLKSRMALTIPQPGESSNDTTEVEENTVAAEEEIADNNEGTVAEGVGSLFGNLLDKIGIKKSTVDVALLLPLNAEGNPSANNLDFYSGFLMAVKELGEEGISTNLSVYDAANGKLPITSGKIAECDMVIGPISSTDLEKLLSLNLSSTPVISPLDQRAERLVSNNKHFIQSPSPYEVQYEDIATWIKDDSQLGDKVILISEKGGQNTQLNAQISSLLTQKGITHTSYSYNILQGRDVNTAMAALLGPQINRVIIASESEAFVNDVVRNLNQLVFQKHNIVLYSSSRIRTFNTIDVENFHSLNMHTSLSYYIDYDSPEVKEFLLDYRALYGTEPSQFSFQGYDIAKFFISSCANDGAGWLEGLSSKDGETLLQNQFLFAEEEGGGFINQGIRRIEYTKDFKIQKAE